ncbi:rRNA methyltransferase [Geomonas limicola]|uniref:rRNA methyltransferase n=1 Tax=Geomonas limicola TaxID=2740186 RepID=A0A6V8N7H4_9BACT|nr:class I SAM-dependent methyltransferase [Geomonas limicola]GFO68330.1 rRNA methyltransferase [Geomonas limicola]
MGRPESLRGAVPLAHFYLRERVREGDRVLDATCGNGQDTLFLAELVGEGGEVWALDVQPRAIAATAELLERHGLSGRVRLVETGHERLGELVCGELAAAVFNLGYLPGGDAALVTVAEKSVAALEQAAGLLKPGGILTVALYTGHEGGPEEAGAVESWAAGLSPREFNVWTCRQLNRPPVAPYLVFVEKVR